MAHAIVKTRACIIFPTVVKLSRLKFNELVRI